MQPIEQFQVNEQTVSIYMDEDPLNPRREWDNFGRMVCWHNRYNRLGDEQPSEDPQEFLKSLPRGTIVLPLYLYEHGGITMRTAPFHCPWDSGQVGYIYATPETIRKAWSIKRITKQIRALVLKVLEGEVETYDDFLTGQVFGYIVKDSEGNELDSCWGCFGLGFCREEARSAAEREEI